MEQINKISAITSPWKENAISGIKFLGLLILKGQTKKITLKKLLVNRPFG